jgi:hypothetical protein
MDRKMCELCRIQLASTHVEIIDRGRRRKLAVCHVHRARLNGPAADDLAAAADRRLDAELADTFPASDPPSILRSGPIST